MSRYTPIIFVLTLGTIWGQTFDLAQAYPVNGLNVSKLSTGVDLDSEDRPVISRMILNRLNYTIPFGDFVLEKLDANGIPLWSDTLSGNVHIQDLLVDRNDDIYVYGRYRDSLDVTGLDFPFSNNSETHAWIAKFDTDGQLTWIGSYTPSNSDLSRFTALCEGDDGMWVASDAGFNHSSIHKLDPGGALTTVIEQEDVGGIYSMSTDTFGGLWVSGATSMGAQSFNGYVASAPFSYNQYIVRYDNNDSAQWVNFIEDVTAEPNQILADPEGYAYFGSPLHDDFVFGDIQSQGPDWVFDFALTRLDSNGNFLWLQEVPLDDHLGDAANGSGSFLDIGPDNSVFFTGFSRRDIDWGNNVITHGDTYYDALLLNYSPDGQILWGKTAGGEWLDQGASLAVASRGDVWLVGRCGETARFDSIDVSGTFTNTFVAHLSMSPTSIDLPEKTPGPQMTLEANYPNPFNPSTQIRFSLNQGSLVDLKIYDVSGREISVLVSTYLDLGSHSIRFESGDLPAGVYIYRLSTPRGVVSRKMLLVR